ncbi:hypothetical protein TELCIR_05761 [Teladorsagia circumcincta]|uniref:Uncharacterized protein n=1 Tax=Teladorsagia circumcincta TaxID=45464 RepID=A0A2G9US54_TELCI|nr:hypothetical protein TELCIR_05761 [Teladorsagia circumcincta]
MGQVVAEKPICTSPYTIAVGRRRQVMCVAWIGIAANILLGGRTMEIALRKQSVNRESPTTNAHGQDYLGWNSHDSKVAGATIVVEVKYQAQYTTRQISLQNFGATIDPNSTPQLC